MALNYPFWFIQTQDLHSNARLWSKRMMESFLVTKVILPHLTLGIEEGCQQTGLRIERTNIGSLVAIASHADQGKVAKDCCPAVLTGNDVIRLVPVEGCRLGKQTIFTTVLRKLAHSGSQRNRNANSHRLFLTGAESRGNLGLKHDD